GNEVAAMVIRHPSLTIEEMLELVCQSVREVAHIAAGSSPEALKGTESAQLIGGSKGEFGRDAIKGAQQFDGCRRTQAPASPADGPSCRRQYRPRRTRTSCVRRRSFAPAVRPPPPW